MGKPRQARKRSKEIDSKRPTAKSVDAAAKVDQVLAITIKGVSYSVSKASRLNSAKYAKLLSSLTENPENKAFITACNEARVSHFNNNRKFSIKYRKKKVSRVALLQTKLDELRREYNSLKKRCELLEKHAIAGGWDSSGPLPVPQSPQDSGVDTDPEPVDAVTELVSDEQSKKSESTQSQQDLHVQQGDDLEPYLIEELSRNSSYAEDGLSCDAISMLDGWDDDGDDDWDDDPEVLDDENAADSIADLLYRGSCLFSFSSLPGERIERTEEISCTK